MGLSGSLEFKTENVKNRHESSLDCAIEHSKHVCFIFEQGAIPKEFLNICKIPPKLFIIIYKMHYDMIPTFLCSHLS